MLRLEVLAHCPEKVADGWPGPWDDRVARLSRAAGSRPLSESCPRSALGAAPAAVAALLDVGSHGPAGRWVLPCLMR